MVRRIFTSFDWTRYHSLAPSLATAVESGDFSRLADDAAIARVEEFDEAAQPREIANAVVVDLCTGEDAVAFETGLSELINWMRRQRDGEEPAELLGTLIGAAPGVEPWFACDAGLAGALTAPDLQELSAAFGAFRRHYTPPEPPRGILALTRRFVPTDVPHARLEDLMLLVDETAARRLGLAVIVED